MNQMDEKQESEQLEKIEKLLQSFVEENPGFTIDLKDWKFQIRIKGPTWKGYVDKPIADFVIDLDKRLREELVRHEIEVPKSNHGLVALRVDEGSTLALLEGVPETLEAIRNFPPKQQMMIFVAILVAAGVWGSLKWRELVSGERKEAEETKRREIESNERLEKDKVLSAERVEIIKALTEGGTRRQLEAPLRTLISKMGDEDVIKLTGTDLVKKDVAKERLEKGTRSKPKNYYIDHPYTIEGISTKNPQKWKITLSYGSVNFVAGMELTEEDMKQLLSSFQAAHDLGTKVAEDLMVTAEINSKGVQRAVVMGIGKPRDKAMRIAEAFRKEGFKPPGF
jgi:hypothetical protein